ncbi:MAG: hypothetical protein P1U34_00225 [Coxiellaceae bacterium]|nr:hypothetical protein [Coxiellaceae bacterium]
MSNIVSIEATEGDDSFEFKALKRVCPESVVVLDFSRGPLARLPVDALGKRVSHYKSKKKKHKSSPVMVRVSRFNDELTSSSQSFFNLQSLVESVFGAKAAEMPSISFALMLKHFTGLYRAASKTVLSRGAMGNKTVEVLRPYYNMVVDFCDQTLVCDSGKSYSAVDYEAMMSYALAVADDASNAFTMKDLLDQIIMRGSVRL